MKTVILLALFFCIIIICIGAYFIGKHLNSIDDSDEIKEYRHWNED